MDPARRIKLAKTFLTAQQWTLRPLLVRLLPAAQPQILNCSIQKHSENASCLNQGGVALLRKSATPKGHDSLSDGTQLQ